MRRSRQYEFKVRGSDSTFNIDVKVGDDLLEAISGNVKKGRVEIVYLAEIVKCQACREDQLGQQAHMNPGGCLYKLSQNNQIDQNDEKSPSTNQQKMKKRRSGTASNPHSVDSSSPEL